MSNPAVNSSSAFESAAAPASAEAGDGPNSYQLLSQALNQQVELLFHTRIQLVQYPSQGDFPWYYQNGNQVFNQATYDYISARVGPGDAAGLVKLSGPGGFPSAYAALLQQLQGPEALLQQLLQATTEPGPDNGGMSVVDPNSGALSCRVGYTVNTPLATIANSLQSQAPTLTVRIPAGGGLTAAISYSGCVMVALQPTFWQPAGGTGWFDPDPLEAESGYRFQATPGYNLGPLEQGGDFGRLVGLLISNPPNIVFSSASAALTDSVSASIARFYAGLSLLGLQPPVMLASQPVVPLLQQRACVVGASLDFLADGLSG